MDCPECGSSETAVIDSRANINGIRRRRMCTDCRFRFTTHEYRDEVLKSFENIKAVNKVLDNFMRELVIMRRAARTIGKIIK